MIQFRNSIYFPQSTITVPFAAAWSDVGVSDALLSLPVLNGIQRWCKLPHRASHSVIYRYGGVFRSSPKPGCMTQDLRQQSRRLPGAESSWRDRAELSFLPLEVAPIARD